MTWPHLSQTLPNKQPGMCQACGSQELLTYWNECDDRDRPTRQFLVLCKPCADKIIEPHPRLYQQVAVVTPMPGVMAVCLDCRSRVLTGCGSPQAMFNGGPGLKYAPEGNMVHVYRRGKGQHSGWEYFAPTPVTSCSGFERKDG